jgi:hypothetical protein
MANIVAWFDPAVSANIRLSGSNVLEWDDFFGWPATQPVTSQGPIYSATSVNGFPGLSGSAVNSAYLQINNLASNVPRTVITIGKLDILSNTNAFLGSSVNGGVEVRVTTGGQIELLKQSVVSIATSSGTAMTNATINILLCGIDFGNYIFRVNGNAYGGSTHSTTGIGGGACQLLGASPDPSFVNQPFGDFILTGDLAATAECQKAEGYLAWKYSLSSLLPAGHPYKSAPP